MSNRVGQRKILAIESAIRGGSVCLLDGETVLGESHGNRDVSRAEDLLANIAALFESTGIRKSQIDATAVSLGPGSYTGIRIGIATALGLARALGCECLGVELLRSMAGASGNMGRIIAAVPFGKHDISYEEFSASEIGLAPSGGPVVEPLDAFLERIADFADAFFVIQKELHPVLLQLRPDVVVIENLAKLIGLHAGSGFGSNDLTPIYIRNPAGAGQF